MLFTTRLIRSRANLVRPNIRSFMTTVPTRVDKVVGIDLGTTNSCVAIMEGEKPIVIENDGKRTTPSIFAIDKDGNRLVGQPAQRQMVVNPQNTFFGVKRLIGRSYEDEETQEYKKQVPYNIVRASNGDAWVSDSKGKQYSPSEIASNILMRLKEVAEQYVGESIDRAVITVPAYFDNHQRQATEAAGQIAGFKVDRIINEPTAAALAYGINKNEDKVIVVYDLGGGTFDISVLQIGGGVFEVKSTAGDTFLGGEDFNTVLANHVANEFKKKEGIDVTKDKVALQRVREAAELAKHDLSSRESVNINLPYITVNSSGVPVTLDVSITRAKYEEMALALVQKSIPPCKKALSDAGISIEDITDVILVGGMTRMPLVRRIVTDFFKREPSLAVNPDEAVAIGAALQGSIIANQGLIPGAEERELILVDVTPLNLGIKVHSGELAVIVPAQTNIPCRLSHVFTTAVDYQTNIDTEVYQGNRPMAKDNRLIGRYSMTGLPPAPAGIPKIEVIFDISANGTITVTSRDLATKNEQKMVITMSGGLSEQEIQRMRKEAEQNQAEDLKKKEEVKSKENAIKDIQHIKKGLAALKNISAEQLAALNEIIEKAEKTIATGDKTQIDTVMTELREKSNAIFSQSYNQQQQASE